LIGISVARWEEIIGTGNVPTPRGSAGLAFSEADNHLYVFGGTIEWTHHVPSNDLYLLDVNRHIWIQINYQGTKPTPVFRHSMIYDSQRDVIFIFGGQISDGGDTGVVVPTNNLWRYQVSTQTFILMPPKNPPPGRFFHVAAVAGRRMFIFGGMTASSFINDLYSYHLDQDTWTRLSNTNAPAGRSNGVGIIDEAGTFLYIFSGSMCFGAGCYKNDLYGYNINTNTWTVIDQGGSNANTPVQRTGAVAANINDKMYVNGGYDLNGVFLQDLWTFDFATKKWTSVPMSGDWPQKRNYHKAVSVANKMFYLFGGYQDLLGQIPRYLQDAWLYAPGTTILNGNNSTIV